MPEPQTTQIRLEHEDSDSRQHHKDQAEGSAQAEADAIEKQDANERLADIAGQGHAPRGRHRGEKSVTGGGMHVGYTEAEDIGEGGGDDAQRVEQAMDGEPPGMIAKGTPCIEQRTGDGIEDTPVEPSAHGHLRQTSVKSVLAYQIAQDEEPQDTRQTMAADKLPHPLTGTLDEEGQHLRIGLGIAEPSGEVALCDAMGVGLSPPEGIERARKVDAGKLRQGIEGHGQTGERDGHCEQHLVTQTEEQGQQHPTHGIEHQDVATPDEHQVAEADDGEDDHPAEEARNGVALQEQGEAHAKEDGEDRVELPIHQHVTEEVHHLVDAARGHLRLLVVAQEGPESELGVVGYDDTQ